MATFSPKILDHHKNPRNKGKLEGATNQAKVESPSCGCTDWIELFLKVSGGKIEDVKFEGEGCVVFTAASSMLTEMIKGKDVSVAQALGENDIREMFGGELSSLREPCAFLPLQALRSALKGA